MKDARRCAEEEPTTVRDSALAEIQFDVSLTVGPTVGLAVGSEDALLYTWKGSYVRNECADEDGDQPNPTRPDPPLSDAHQAEPEAHKDARVTTNSRSEDGGDPGSVEAKPKRFGGLDPVRVRLGQRCEWVLAARAKFLQRWFRSTKKKQKVGQPSPWSRGGMRAYLPVWRREIVTACSKTTQAVHSDFEAQGRRARGMC